MESASTAAKSVLGLEYANMGETSTDARNAKEQLAFVSMEGRDMIVLIARVLDAARHTTS